MSHFATDYSPHIGHSDYRWGPRGSDSSSHSSFLERCVEPFLSQLRLRRNDALVYHCIFYMLSFIDHLVDMSGYFQDKALYIICKT